MSGPDKGRDYLPMPDGLAAAMHAAKPGEVFEYDGQRYSVPEPAPDWDKVRWQSAKPNLPPSGRKRRRCLRCSDHFMSEGSHNHLCPPCGAANTGSTAGEAYGIGRPR